MMIALLPIISQGLMEISVGTSPLLVKTITSWDQQVRIMEKISVLFILFFLFVSKIYSRNVK